MKREKFSLQSVTVMGRNARALRGWVCGGLRGQGHFPQIKIELNVQICVLVNLAG